jgi:CheY-like chemotaxis protein
MNSQPKTPIDVLIVEDDETLRRDYRLLLSRHGYSFAEAGTGGEAIRLARLLSPRCVLLAQSLQEVDGLTVADALRADPKTCQTRIICVTDRGNSGDYGQSHQRESEWLLTKPVIPEVLLGAVQRPSPAPVLAGDGADCLLGTQALEAPGATLQVTVITEDGQEFRPVGVALAANEIRVIDKRPLLGQNLRVVIADADGGTHNLSIRILWTFPFDGGLVENGGVPLDEP